MIFPTVDRVGWMSLLNPTHWRPLSQTQHHNSMKSTDLFYSSEHKQIDLHWKSANITRVLTIQQEFASVPTAALLQWSQLSMCENR